MRQSQLCPLRERALSNAEGRVLEVGVGGGSNLPLYTAPVREVIGLDPHRDLLKMARGISHSVPVWFVEGSAEFIPLGDESVDSVVMTWTLCSIPNPSTALFEIRRVLKPNGLLLFVEHGLSREDRVARWQRWMTPSWRLFTGGCHLDRPVSELVANAGFVLTRLETAYISGPKPMTFMYEGIARRRP
ncbi:MAG: class I SAM-dependent methyltransferase [Bryobacterales bacterium]|nr:class I SAM-dependent methyltransferase [Bryobacterales bacterium]